jgi:diguanylate cyclase (GGDEF)-like protein
VLTSVLFMFDLMPYRLTGSVATLLGPVPMLLGVPVAWLRARRGDRAAVFIFVGWGLYSVGVVVMMAFLRGYAPANFWTQHAMQFSSLCEMAMWMLVLGVRAEEIRHAAEQAQRDRDRMAWLAHTDPLTGALNRRGLHGALQPLLEGASLQSPQALYLLDLDGFKLVNDTHGHEVGDALLIEVVRRLHAVLRGQDLVARTGGDEFVVVAAGLISAAQAEIVGNKLMQAFGSDFDVLGCCCHVGVTVGYVLIPADGRDADALLRYADAAMYAGKQAGKCQLRRAAEVAAVT